MDTPWVHTLDPFAVGPIRWYGLAYLAGFICAYFLVRRVMRASTSPLPPSKASDLIFALVLGVMIGGRLGYVAFYQPSLLWTFSERLPFWEALAINRGGMASHGGMIGVVIAALIFAHRQRAPFLYVVDLAAFGAPLGLFFGRLANFVNGELYGRPAPDLLPWAVKFPQEMHAWNALQLLQMHQSLARVQRDAPAVDDVIEALQRDDTVVSTAIAPLLLARHPSQIYEALLEGLFVFAVLLVAWRVARKPGTIAATFGIVYAFVRIFGEQFRLPDAPVLAVLGIEVTRGQLLSIVLLAASLGLALLVHRQNRQAGGGWLKGPRRHLP